MWYDIKGYEDLYEINENAVIRRKKGNGSDGRSIESHVVVASNTRKGTKYISLWKGGERKTFMLHKLYAEAFGVSENQAKRKIYLGFHGDRAAVDKVCDSLYEVLDSYAAEEKKGISRNDEILYIRQFLYELKNDMAGCYVEAQNAKDRKGHTGSEREKRYA